MVRTVNLVVDRQKWPKSEQFFVHLLITCQFKHDLSVLNISRIFSLFKMKSEQPAKVQNILPTCDPHIGPSTVISTRFVLPITTRQLLGGCQNTSVSKPLLQWLLHNEEIAEVSKCHYHYVNTCTCDVQRDLNKVFLHIRTTSMRQFSWVCF